jgi:hypothetical protein
MVSGADLQAMPFQIAVDLGEDALAQFMEFEQMAGWSGFAAFDLRPGTGIES